MDEGFATGYAIGQNDSKNNGGFGFGAEGMALGEEEHQHEDVVDVGADEGQSRGEDYREHGYSY